jgi:hypothetical protein
VDVSAAFVAGAEPLEGVQPGEAALHHPALLARSRAVGDAAASNPRRDAALSQPAAIDVVVVAAVGEQLPRPGTGPPAASPDERHLRGRRLRPSDVELLVVRAALGRCPRAHAAALCSRLPPGRRDAHEGRAGHPGPRVLRDNRGHLEPRRSRTAARGGRPARRGAPVATAAVLRPRCCSDARGGPALTADPPLTCGLPSG